MRFGSLGRAHGKLGAPPKAGAGAGAVISLSGNTISEGAANGTVVGTASITGQSYTGTPAWTLVDDAGLRFAIDGSTGVVTKTAPLNYELAASHNITIAVSGTTPDPSNVIVEIAVIDVPAPSMTSSATGTVEENEVLTFTLTATEPSTFAITGGADDAEFEISSTTLRWTANGVQDYESPEDAGANNTYVVQVTPTSVSTGEVGVAQTITITVTDEVVELEQLLAPTLDLQAGSDVGYGTNTDNSTTDTTPDIDLIGGQPFLVGDLISVDDDGVLIIEDYEIDADDVADGFHVFAGTALSDGEHPLRAKHKRAGYADSEWSETLTITIVSGDYETESEAYFARCPTPLSETDKGYVDTLIAGLKSDGVWTKLLALYLPACSDQDNAVLNLVSSSFELIENGTPTWDAYEGYTGSSGKYLDTQLAPYPDGGSTYAQDSAHFSAYIRNDRTSAGHYLIGGTVGSNGAETFINPHYTGDITYWDVNSTTYPTNASTTSQGFWCITRRGSGISQSIELYRDGVSIDSATSTSIGLSQYPFYYLAYNVNGTASYHSIDQFSAGSIGAALSDAEAAALNTHIQDYMTSISAPSYDADAQAYFDRTASTISSTNKGYINDLIVSLKADGLWTKLDALYLLAQEHQNNAVINLKSSSYTITEVSAPAWTQYEGYTGDNTADYLNTNFTPSTASGLFTQNDCHLSVYIRNNRTSGAAYVICGTSGTSGGDTFIDPLFTGNLTYWDVNSTSYPNVAATTARGFWCITRRAASGTGSIELYRNGSSVQEFNDTSAALSNQPIYLLAHNVNGTPTYHCPDQMAVATIGGTLLDAEVADLNTHIETYMDALGKGIQ